MILEVIIYIQRDGWMDGWTDEINSEKEISLNLTCITVRETDRHEIDKYSSIAKGECFENIERIMTVNASGI